jgi:undecaprenyl-diphosphatase
MNLFDAELMSLINQAAQHSAFFDKTVVFLSNSDLVKGGTIVGAMWAAWFFRGGDQDKNRAFLLSAILGCLWALLLARILAYVIPLRIRPLLDPQMHFRPPIGLPNQSNWTFWSSFPSDHAALFFALATGVWCVNRKGGGFLFLYILIFICLPRLYVGIHYPTDIIAGAVIGVTCVEIFSSDLGRRLLAQPILNWGKRHPALFYFALFFLTFQIATLFWDVRVALSLFGFSV